jgi:hypothetical protein
LSRGFADYAPFFPGPSVFHPHLIRLRPTDGFISSP